MSESEGAASAAAPRPRTRATCGNCGRPIQYVMSDERKNPDGTPLAWWTHTSHGMHYTDCGLSATPEQRRMAEVSLLAKEIALKVVEFNDGKLKRTARDYISGLIRAYGLLIGIEDSDRAMNAAITEARQA